MKTESLGFVSSCNIHIQMKNSDLRLRKICYSLEPGSNLKIIVQHKTARIQILIPVDLSSTEVGCITMSPIHMQVLDQYEIHEWIPSSKPGSSDIYGYNSAF